MPLGVLSEDGAISDNTVKGVSIDSSKLVKGVATMKLDSRGKEDSSSPHNVTLGLDECRLRLVSHRGVIRSRIGPDWTEDRIRVEARTENRTGPVLDRFWAEKWHGLPVPHGTAVPPLFFVGHGCATHFIRSTLFFFVGHCQTVLSGTTASPHFIRSISPDRDWTEDRK